MYLRRQAKLVGHVGFGGAPQQAAQGRLEQGQQAGAGCRQGMQTEKGCMGRKLWVRWGV